ncbi:MAG: hypothetical protein QOK15_758 [Nocardioidaceae bacterium]|jgi:anaerobic selenocysteine-containing dehydrogenase|nr:hypothetical protein [Nocardioidaceae bacterium]
MGQTSRRTFLNSAGAGAAVGVVGIGASSASASAAVRQGNAAQETVVAYVEDHQGSQVRLLVGEREVVVRDRDLVVRLLNAAGGE